MSYAALHWVEHAKYEGVASRIQGSMEELSNPKQRHLAAWISIHNAARDWYGQSLDYYPTRPQAPPEAAALFYAVFGGLREVADYLITTHAADVNAHYGDLGAPLHMASGRGHAEVVYLLLRHKGHMNNHSPSYQDWTPLLFASYYGHVEVVQLRLEHAADVNAQALSHSTPLWFASEKGHLEVVHLLLGHGADVHIRGLYSHTPLQRATNVKIAQLLLEKAQNGNKTEAQAYNCHYRILSMANSVSSIHTIQFLSSDVAHLIHSIAPWIELVLAPVVRFNLGLCHAALVPLSLP